MGAAGQKTNIGDQSVAIATKKKAIGAMAFPCERGPIGKPMLILNTPQLRRIYGNPLPGRSEQIVAETALDAGCWLYVSRVVHLTDPTSLATKTSAPATVTLKDRSSVASSGESAGSAVFPLRGIAGGTLIVAVNGGSNQTATFRATPAIITGSGATYAAVTASHTLTVTVNGVARVVTFAGTENTQALYLAALNLQLPGVVAFNSSGQVRLQTDKQGSGASIAVSAGDADVLAALGLSVASGTNAGPNDVADIEAVTASEFTSVVQAAVTGVTAGANGSNHPFIRSTTTGGGSSVLVQAASTLDTPFGFDNSTHTGSGSAGVNTLRIDLWDGTYGNSCYCVVEDDPSDTTNLFRLTIVDSVGNVVAGPFAGLSMDSAHPQYAVNVLRASEAIQTVTNLNSPTVAPTNRPAVGSFAFSGGLDGLSGLAIDDYIGNASQKTGLHAFDTVRDFAKVALPGVSTHAIQVKAREYCQARNDCEFVAITPLDSNPIDAIDWRFGRGAYSHTREDTFRASLYFGWYKRLHPITKQEVWVSPEGNVFAAFARANEALGPWLPAAGGEVGKFESDFIEFKYELGSDERDALYDAGINPCYNDVDFGPVVWGNKSLQIALSQLQSTHIVALTLFLGVQISASNKIDVFKLNDSDTWRGQRQRAEKFLRNLPRALQGFRVVADDSNNTPATQTAKQTKLDVYFVPTGSAEELVLNLNVMPFGTTFNID